ncbi:hypothetical protein [Stutzerimonas stutzeri]|uniref:Uncharacterized protein n=1 Tax=Stutzerimonas stutzeri TaxID=316 RepID=A0A6I6LKJ9_STUST|nr:hypothetical protein [Stutzerimonas stutzeri]QGZ29367.1 hypothetical protein GQA94_04515 [Stutzerimonas stutzeri]
MKADCNDAPEYITRRPRKSRRLAKLIPGLIGTIITLVVLQMAGSAFLKGTVQGIAEKRIQPKPAPVAEITRAEPAATKDWDRLVEEVAASGATPQPQSPQPLAVTTESPSKRTVFNDKNYKARGADNVLSFQEPPQPIERKKTTGNKEVIVVGQKRSMKDQACWPYKDGSIEERNCRARVGLNYRD